MIRAVVVEDEPLARRFLATLLARTGRVEVVGEAANGRDGLRVCEEVAPDAAFLDVRMPGADGLAVASRFRNLPRPPLVVFVTAFAGHAVDAFEVEAVDYLLKPIDRESVARAVRRLESRLESGASPLDRDRLPARAPGEGAIRLVSRGEVLVALTRNRRTWVHLATEELIVAKPLAAVADWLGGPPFLRVARDAVVNSSAIVNIARVGERHYEIRLADRPATVVETSRSAASLVASMLK